MGRELKRREEKNNKKVNNNKKDVDFNTEITTIGALKLIFAIVLILFVIYYILAVFVTKEIDISNNNTNKETSTDTTTITNKILAANIFEQKESTYYVYFYDFDDSENDLSSLISNNIDDKLYKVDTSSGLNSKYVSDDAGNKNANSIDDLKVISNTLIRVEDDKITEYYEGKSSIMDSIN